MAVAAAGALAAPVQQGRFLKRPSAIRNREPPTEWLSVPTDKDANVGLKVAPLAAGMVAGARGLDR